MNGYKKTLIDAMGVKENETVLILTDEDRIEIGKKFHKEAMEIARESYLLVMKKRRVSGTELPKEVAEMMKIVDVVLAPTSVSMTHTKAKLEAIKTGTRIASMPGITEDMLEHGAINADFDEVIYLTQKVAELLTKSSTATIIKDTHKLVMDIRDRKGIKSPGVYRNKGEAGNLPSGEAFIAPIEDGTNGTMIIDGSMVGIGLLKDPLEITIKNGKITELKGDKENKLSILFESEENHTIAELGIGTNKAARLIGIILEDEKIFGTVHIAFGTNISFGGKTKASCHLDGIILKPTLYLDDMLIIENGEFKI